MKTVTLTHHYKSPARDVWALATNYGVLAEVMRGLITFTGLPEGRTYTGQSVTVMVSLFGKLPPQPYHMEVLECDDQAMILRSAERGAGVKSWQHTLQVMETEDGCSLSDRIEIDAGWLTTPFAWWARYLYKKRHAPRLRLLRGES